MLLKAVPQLVPSPPGAPASTYQTAAWIDALEKINPPKKQRNKTEFNIFFLIFPSPNRFLRKFTSLIRRQGLFVLYG
jgi:hypothetical protein